MPGLQLKSWVRNPCAQLQPEPGTEHFAGGSALPVPGCILEQDLHLDGTTAMGQKRGPALKDGSLSKVDSARIPPVVCHCFQLCCPHTTVIYHLIVHVPVDHPGPSAWELPDHSASRFADGPDTLQCLGLEATRRCRAHRICPKHQWLCAGGACFADAVQFLTTQN